MDVSALWPIRERMDFEMPVLNREAFFNRVHDVFGSDTSPENISFIEDMTDTYADLEKRANGDGMDWKQKYEENDKAWREKYQHRFFSSGGGEFNPSEGAEQNPSDNKPSDVTFGDLFT